MLKNFLFRSADEKKVDLNVRVTAYRRRETEVDKLRRIPGLIHSYRKSFLEAIAAKSDVALQTTLDTPSLFSEASRDYSLTTTEEKCYDPNDPTLTFVDREDELDFLCEGFKSLRALMSCGHAVTPMSLTNWCLRQLDEGEGRFVCGQSGCNAEWSYAEVRKMALLTPEEMKHFEKAMASNAARGNTKPCPRCKSSVVRKNQFNLRVRCTVCPTNKDRTFKFCWQCMKEWKGPYPRSDHCENEGCTNESLKTLQTCPDAVFESVKGVTGCPSIRACPRCGILLQHNDRACKKVICPHCRHGFCFVCLKRTAECLKTSDPYKKCTSGVAPRQTFIPVWQMKLYKQPHITA